MSTDDLRRRMMERKLAERSGATAAPADNAAPDDVDGQLRRQRLLRQREQPEPVVEDPNQLVSDETAARLKAAGDLAARVGRGSLALSRGLAQTVVEKSREVRAERSARPKQARSRRLPWTLSGVAMLALIGGGAWWWTSRDKKPEPATAAEMTMPVVPAAAPVYTPPTQSEPTPPVVPEVVPAPAEIESGAPAQETPALTPGVVPDPLFIPSPSAHAAPPEPVKATPAPAPKPAAAQARRAPPKVGAREQAQIEAIHDWGKQQQASQSNAPAEKGADPDLEKMSQAVDDFFKDRQADQ